MWVVEVNILGRRFTHQVDDRREALKVRSRAAQSRLSQLRRPRAGTHTAYAGTTTDRSPVDPANRQTTAAP